MSSGFSGGGGAPDFFSAGGRSTNISSSSNANFNAQQQFCFRSPLSGALPDPNVQIRRSDFMGKRSLSEFQQQNQERLGFYLRNVKQRPNYLHASPISTLSPADFSPVPSLSPEVSSVSILQQHRLQPLTLSNCILSPNLSMNKRTGDTGTGMSPAGLGSESEKKMMNHRLQELEKELLGDEEDGEAVSVVTNNEWSDTIQNLINPTRKPISPSRTSSSSSCSSTSASPPIPCIKQSFIDAAVAISDGKPEVAAEILTRLQQVANSRGTSEQRLTAYMVSALKSRVYPTEHPPPASELYGKEHVLSTQLLYDVSPCFKLGFMAANLAILDATSEQGFQKIHVVDFEIGEGGQYMHLLHALAARKPENKRAAALTITTFTDFSTNGAEKRFEPREIGNRARRSPSCQLRFQTLQTPRRERDDGESQRRPPPPHKATLSDSNDGGGAGNKRQHRSITRPRSRSFGTLRSVVRLAGGDGLLAEPGPSPDRGSAGSETR